jgi:DNA-directed RNA polymerase specialized sigma24 family protein
MARGLSYTSEEDRTILELYKEKVPYRSIAKVLNRSADAVKNRASVLRREAAADEQA